MSANDVQVVMSDIDHPEGVAVAPDGAIWAGGEAAQVYRAMPGDPPTQIATLAGRTLGLAFDASGIAYFCDESEPAVFRVTAGGQASVFSRGCSDRPLRVPNYPAFLPEGPLLVSDSGDWGQSNGLLFAIEPDGAAHVLTDRPAEYTNGLCVSADGRTVYVVESSLPGVSAISLDSKHVVVGYEPVVQLSDAVPDGIALDDEERLYISCFVPDAIYVLQPSGDLETVLHDRERVVVNEPTNIAFGGEGLHDLYFANCGARHVARVRLETRGQRPHLPPFEA